MLSILEILQLGLILFFSSLVTAQSSSLCGSAFDSCAKDNEFYRINLCLPLHSSNATKSEECVCLVLVKTNECFKNCMNSTLINEQRKNHTDAMGKTCLKVGLNPLTISPDKWIQFGIPGLANPPFSNLQSLPTPSVDVGLSLPTLPILFPQKSSKSVLPPTESPEAGLLQSRADPSVYPSLSLYFFGLTLGFAILL